MALHHTAQIPRLIKLSLYNYLKDQLTSGGMTTGTNAVQLMDAYPPWTDEIDLSTPMVILAHMGWSATGYQLGGGDYLTYSFILSILSSNKNQREDLAYIVESFLRNKKTNLIDYNVSSSTVIGTMEFENVYVSSPFLPLIGNLPEEYDYLIEIGATLRVYVY